MPNPGSSASTIVSIACQIAKAPGYTQQAGQLLNMILADLNQSYDLDICQGTQAITLVADNGSGNGAGPYALNPDYLRSAKDDVFWTLLGVKYVLKNISKADYDALVLQSGIASYPVYYATDLSLSNNATSVLYVWPPSSGAYPLTVCYYRQMPDITTPESSSTVPWFPNQEYLVTALAGRIMQISGDARAAQFIGDPEHNTGACGILKRYLKMTNDHEDRALTVTRSRTRFGVGWSKLPNTKIVGW